MTADVHITTLTTNVWPHHIGAIKQLNTSVCTYSANVSPVDGAAVAVTAEATAAGLASRDAAGVTSRDAAGVTSRERTALRTSTLCSSDGRRGVTRLRRGVAAAVGREVLRRGVLGRDVLRRRDVDSERVSSPPKSAAHKSG